VLKVPIAVERIMLTQMFTKAGATRSSLSRLLPFLLSPSRGALPQIKPSGGDQLAVAQNLRLPADVGVLYLVKIRPRLTRAGFLLVR
jgi:hypothetical protein